MEINNQIDNIQTLDNMLTLKEVAMLLHVHPNTLRRWSDEGKIGSFRINNRGDRRFMTQDIVSFLNGKNNHNHQ
jgi:excisionase family DNA binding protein